MKAEGKIQLAIIIHLTIGSLIGSFAQGTYTSVANTAWTTGSTWTCTSGTCGTYPGTNVNDVAIVIDNQVTLNSVSPITISSLSITSTGSSNSQLSIVGTTSLTVTSNVTITKGSSTTTRLRLGGSSTASTSSMIVNGDLTYNYNNGGESVAEISVGSNTTGDASINDNCSLLITNNLILNYNYGSSSSSGDILEIKIGNQSSTATSHVNDVSVGDVIANATASSINPKIKVNLYGNTSTFNVGTSGTSGTGTVTMSSVSTDATNPDLNFSIDGAPTISGIASCKILNVGDGVGANIKGSSTIQFNIANPGSNAVNISGVTKTSELIVSEDANMNVNGDISIVRNNTSSNAVRLKVGGTNGVVSTSSVTVTGNLVYDYLNIVGSESGTEISVGNSNNPDACMLAITGNVTLNYSYPGSANGNVLAFEVGNASSASMNNITMNLTESGSGTGCDIRVATNDDIGSSIIINGDATMSWTDGSSPNSDADIYFKPGNDGATSNTSIWIKGNLYMATNVSTGTINNHVRVSGNSSFTLGQPSGGGNIYFSASTPTSSSYENRITLNENGIFNLYGSLNNQQEGSFDFKPTGSTNPNGTVPNGTLGLYGTAANSDQVFPQVFRSNTYPDNNFKNVIINNTKGTNLVIPLSTLNIEGSLTMTNGIITSTSSNQLIFEDGATSNGGTSTSFIVGPVLKKGGSTNNGLIFPIGNGTRWTPLEIGNLSGSNSSTTFTVEYFDNAFSLLTTDLTFDHVSGREYWELNVVGTPTVDLTLYWKDACWSEIYDLTTGGSQDLFIGHYNGTNWNKVSGTYTLSGSAGSIATCPGTFTGSIKVTGVSSFSPFTFIAQGTTNNPLPIKLNDFWWKRKGDAIKILWSTSSELNSDYFILQHSSNGYQFSSIDTIKASGTSTELNQYESIDYFPNSGVNYYQLLEYDLDGIQFNHGVISVILNSSESNDVEVFPNPVNNNSLNIYVRSDEVYSENSFKVLSALGKNLTHVCAFKQLESNKFIIDTNQLTPGLYFLFFHGQNSEQLIKFIVE